MKDHLIQNLEAIANQMDENGKDILAKNIREGVEELKRCEKLQLLADDLPHCWRLDENEELIHDVPVIPGMIVWHAYPNHIKFQEGAPWECEVISISESAYILVRIKNPGTDFETDIMEPDETELYSNTEAAKVAIEIIAKKDAKRAEEKNLLNRVMDKYKVPDKWRIHFIKLVKHGSISKNFETFLDQDQDCQKAIEEIFIEDTKNFEDIIKTLKG